SSAEHIIEEANKTAMNLKKEKMLEAKEYNQKLKEEFDREQSDTRQNLQAFESRLLSREESLDRKSESLDKKDELLDLKEAKIEDKLSSEDAKEEEIDESIRGEDDDGTRIAGLTRAEAKDEIFREIENELLLDMVVMLNAPIEEAEYEADKKAK